MEHRRIELSSIQPKTKQDKSKKLPPTLRFDLELNEPTKDACPEFSYTELLKDVLVSEEFPIEFYIRMSLYYFSFRWYAYI